LDLSIIILNYKTPDLTINCLKSIYRTKPAFKFETIVLDNNSRDNSQKRIMDSFPQISYLAEKTNHGFAKGNNLAAKKAKGKYLLFLNSDTLVFPDTLEKAFKFIKSQNNIGVLGIKLLNKNKTIQRSIFRFPGLKLFLAELLFLPLLGLFNDYRYFSYKKIKNVDFVSGAFLFIPAQVFRRIKGFDQSFFMYAEETDLCYRIKKLGRKIVFYPGAKLIHLGGGSTSNNTKKEELLLTGKSLFIKKHCPAKLCFFLLGVNNFIRLVLTSLLPGKNKKYLTLLKYYLKELVNN